jgi:hypothetical protein
VGGVSEGPTRGTRLAEQSDGLSPDVDATVEGIPVYGMALAFAGQRRNVGLGSVRQRERVSSPLGDAPATADVQRALRKGTTSACTLRSACTGPEKRGNVLLSRRQNTRPSLGPLTRARLSPLQLRRGNSRRWRVRIGIAVGQTWRKPGRTGTGVEANGRCATRRLSPLPQGRGRGR